MDTTVDERDDTSFELTSPAGPTTEDSGVPVPAVAKEALEATLRPLLEGSELQAVLEALLFVSHDSVSVDRLVSAIGDVPKHQIVESLRALQSSYEREQRGMQLVEIAGGWQMVTRPEHGAWIKRLDKSKAAPKLSRSALESLAIIAYKQPIVRAEIEQIRGVETSGVIRTLLERKFVRIVGRKEVPGRPIMYGTTKFFLQHFGLKDLGELPPLREFKELGEAEQATLPVEDDPLTIMPEDASPQPVDPSVGVPVGEGAVRDQHEPCLGSNDADLN